VTNARRVAAVARRAWPGTGARDARAAEDIGRDLEIILASDDRVRVSAQLSVETMRGVIQVLRGGMLTVSPAVPSPAIIGSPS
jgi:hypothetical protein